MAAQAPFFFQGIQMLADAFRQANENAMEYYRSLQNITVAQAALAQQGTAVTNQEMLDIVNQLHEKWQTIAQTDITEAVAKAISTRSTCCVEFARPATVPRPTPVNGKSCSAYRARDQISIRASSESC